MNVSIIIVNYKSKDLTLNCIKSIRSANWSGLTYEIIVVDNYSLDLSAEDLKPFGDINFILNGKNLGMGAANNQGARAAQGKYIAIMNPDTAAAKDAFRRLYEFMEHNPRAGIAGPKQLNPNGSLQASCFRWPRLLTPLFRRTPLGASRPGKKDLDRFLYKDYNMNSASLEVDWLLGSFLFFRAEALRQVGMFDERFFLYFEDTDLCKRFWQAGWKVIYYPPAVIVHNHLRESARAPWYKFFTNKAAWHHLASWARYLWKWKLR
ncbi:MAG: glycosyltransferase family 2 protein [bacterium]|nr:glycosyltransferase family 2 protein [bacterium]